MVIVQTLKSITAINNDGITPTDHGTPMKYAPGLVVAVLPVIFCIETFILYTVWYIQWCGNFDHYDVNWALQKQQNMNSQYHNIYTRGGLTVVWTGWIYNFLIGWRQFWMSKLLILNSGDGLVILTLQSIICAMSKYKWLNANKRILNKSLDMGVCPGVSN